VQEGARITVTSADGQRLDYTVTSVERITKAALPVDRLFDPDVKHRLVVITCGGRFLPDAGGYEDNIVVIATLAAGLVFALRPLAARPAQVLRAQE
jgi:hypothetical protein